MTKPIRLRTDPATTLPPAVAAERLDRIRAKLQAMDDPMGATDRAILNVMALGTASSLTAGAVDAAADHLAARFEAAFSHYRDALDIALGNDDGAEMPDRGDQEVAATVRAVVADGDRDPYHTPLVDLEGEIHAVRLAAANIACLGEMMDLLGERGETPPDNVGDAIAFIADALQITGAKMVELHKDALGEKTALRTELAALKARGAAA